MFLLLALFATAFQVRAVTHFHDVAISPDGRRVAWTQSDTLYAGPDSPVPLDVQGPHTDSSPDWSPDSNSLVFLSDAGQSGQKQLWLYRSGSQAKLLAPLNGYVERPRWSPDGKRVAFLYVEGASGGGPLGAAAAVTGTAGEAIHNQRIAVVDVASGALSFASPADLHVYDFDWSPDGSRFVATAAPGPGDNNWWVAKIYTMDTASGSAKAIYKPNLQVAVPRWSPDGKHIAFIEGVMSDEGFHGGDLITIAADGSDRVNRTEGRKSSPSFAAWRSPNRLIFAEWSGGGSAISTLDLSNGVIETLWKGPESAVAGGFRGNIAFARQSPNVAWVRSSHTAPPEIWTGTPGDWKPLTHTNSGVQATWGRAESVEWENEGSAVQGWLIPPPKVESGRRYPMVVVVHGGPSGVVTSGWPEGLSLPHLLATEGYYVFEPNPRGSYGRGEAFTRANVKDFGGGDLRDILSGVDRVLATRPVDADRVGVFGWSYGGYMTMWAVTQTQRFKAAVAGAGIANWVSYYGQNGIDQWMIPFFGASVYDDPAVYAKSSPINFIKQVKTPTLVVVGERDAECPAPQSLEFWHALKTLGVPTELVIYPGEGHMFVGPGHQRDLTDRIVAWFGKYLTSSAPSTTSTKAAGAAVGHQD
jgi:dipeptidyl aminopeptidase/acylaminoacyl peptidase